MVMVLRRESDYVRSLLDFEPSMLIPRRELARILQQRLGLIYKRLTVNEASACDAIYCLSNPLLSGYMHGNIGSRFMCAPFKFCMTLACCCMERKLQELLSEGCRVWCLLKRLDYLDLDVSASRISLS